MARVHAPRRDPTPSRQPAVERSANDGGIERGSSVGRYVVLDVLGAGGMGVVYAAYDPDLDRKVAVKLLKTRHDSPNKDSDDALVSSLRARLLREAQALAKLSHANVVTVYDVGTCDGDVFMAMEFVDGQTIRKWCKQAERTWREVVSVFIKAGRGLAAAHRVGLTHRDFKPDNALVDASGGVFVVDFGLVHAYQTEVSDSTSGASGRALESTSGRGAAHQSNAAHSLASAVTVPFDDVSHTEVLEERAQWDQASFTPDELDSMAAATSVASLEPDATVAPTSISIDERDGVGPWHESTSSQSTDASAMGIRLTEFGTVMGTPAYMAPEQHAGEVTDARSDQFSFCVALYEALYGLRPFAGDSPRAIHRAMLRGDLRAPSSPVRVPPWLRRIIARGLSADPALRYPSMDALLADLSRDPARLRRRVLGGTVVAALLGTGTMMYVRQQAVHGDVCSGGEAKVGEIWSQGHRDRIQRAFVALNLPYAQSSFQAASSALHDYASAWAQMHRQACEATRRGEQSESLLDVRMSCLAGRYDAMAGLVAVWEQPDETVVEKALNAAFDLPRIERCADTTALLAQAPLPDDPQKREQVAMLQVELASVGAQRYSQRFQEAEAALPPLIEQIQATGYAPLLAEAYTLLGVAQSTLGKPDQAVTSHRAAMYAAERVGAAELAATASFGLIWDDAYLRRRFDLADEYIQHSLALLTAANNPPHVEAHLHHVVGVIEGARGHQEREIWHTRRAFELRKANLEPGHPGTLRTATNLALALSSPRAEDTQEALELLGELIALARTIWPEGHPDLAMALSNLGAIYSRGGHYQQALATMTETWDMYQRIGRANSIWGEQTPTRVADAYRELGRRHEALEAITNIDRLARAPTIDCRWGTVFWGVPVLSAVYLDLGQTETALELATRSVDACRALLGEDHLDTVGVAEARAGALIEAGQVDAALAELDRIDAATREVPVDRQGDRIRRRSLRGDAYRRAGELEQARAIHAEIIDQAAAAFGEAHPRYGEAAATYGRTLSALGELSAAIEWFERAVGVLEARVGASSPRLADVLVDLADALGGRGDRDAAERTARRVRTLCESGECPPQWGDRTAQWLTPP